MSEIPKRSDDIYKEIEQLEDYEFINCIAYEMAIRNIKVKNIKVEIKNLLISLRENYSSIRENNSNILNIEFDKIYEEWLEYQNTKFEDDEDKIEPNYENYILDNLEDYHQIKSHLNTLLNSYWIRYFYEEHILEYSLKDNSNLEYYELKRKLKENNIVNEFDNIDIDKGEIIKKKNDFSCINKHCTINLNRLYPNINLDKNLIIPKEHNKNISLQVNLNLPKDELVAYITKIKDEYDRDNSIIKTSLELLGGVSEKANNKKINKRLIADKFFIYDFIKSRQKEIEEHNEAYYEDYEEDKRKIENSPYETSNDKKTQLKELKKEFEENTGKRIQELFNDIENFTPATAKRYYYEIKPFIDDCKYKELITRTISN